MKSPKTKSDLQDCLNKNGVLTVPAGVIRDIYGYKKLGRHVRSEISNDLEVATIAHYPEDFPSNQYTFVRLVWMDSPTEQLIQSVINPSPKNDKDIQRCVRADGDLKSLKKILRDSLEESGVSVVGLAG